MKQSKRGTSPNTRSAVKAANLRRKIIRIHKELGSIAVYLGEGSCPICKKPFSECEYFQELED